MLADLWQQAVSWHSQRLPFVLYRKPGEEIVTGVFQENNKLLQAEDFTETGFIFAPFDTDIKPILIAPDKVLTAANKMPVKQHLPSANQEQNNRDKKQHIALILKAIAEINKGVIKKVVVSRIQEITCNKDAVDIFKALLSLYRNAFCYLWYHPKIGLWLGASPEMLLDLNGKKLTTISLAATQKWREARAPDWGVKELEEQALVTKYIQEVLKDKVKDMRTTEATAVRAGKLWHLKSEISGSIDSEQLKEIVQTLHPTPAVCGIPPEVAKDFIAQYETYDRSFYTGYLGELNADSKKSHLFVNIRCMRLKEGKAYVYVGGGITKDSLAEKEWQETEDKAATVANALLISEE